MTRNPLSTSWYRHRAALLTLCGVMCLAAPARAQFDSAQLSGIVRDTTGGVLPGVDVTLTSVGTGLERRAVTNEAGLYTFPNVPVGEYTITAMLSGFRPVTQTGVRPDGRRQHPRRRSARARRRERDHPGGGRHDAGRYGGDRPHPARRRDCGNPAQRTPRRHRSRNWRRASSAATWAGRCRPGRARSRPASPRSTAAAPTSSSRRSTARRRSGSAPRAAS